LSEATQSVIGKFSDGSGFEAVGEITFMDRYVVVYDVDGGTAYLFYSNLLYLLVETSDPVETFEPPF
jgi:hypothetical protein